MRGPDYADHLTEAERRTLDQLVGAVQRRRQWRAPVAAGVAALLVVLGVAAIGLVGRDPGGTPVVPAGSDGPGPAAAAETLADLAGQAQRMAPPTDPDPEWWYRKRLDVMVAPEEPCRVLAAMIETWEPAGDPQRPGRIAAEPAAPPATATDLAGCAIITEVPVPLFEQTGDVAGAWEELAAQLNGLAPRYLPSRLVMEEEPPAGYPEPEQLADLLGAGQQETDAPGGWWAALVRLLASPQADPRLRAAALEAAALRATTTGEEAQVVPDRTADLTGRPGVTVRVPYYLDGRTVSAELIFDTTTGDLLQSIVNELEITVFLAIGQP